MRFCNDCNDEKMCNKVNNQINENKDIEAKIYLLKRHASNEFAHMFLYFKEEDDLFVINYLNRRSILICFI